MKLPRIFTGILTGAAIAVFALMTALNLLGFKSYSIMSGSMEPKYGINDIVLVDTKGGAKGIKENDVIAFHKFSNVVIHRAVGITDAGIITKGDANSSVDADPAPREAVIGKVVYNLDNYSELYRTISDHRIELVIGITVLNIITSIFCWLLSKLSNESSDNEDNQGDKDTDEAARLCCPAK